MSAIRRLKRRAKRNITRADIASRRYMTWWRYHIKVGSPGEREFRYQIVRQTWWRP